MVRIIDHETRTLIEELRGTRRGNGNLVDYQIAKRHFDKSVVIDVPEGVNLELFKCNFDEDLMIVATRTAIHYGISQVKMSNVTVDGSFSINTGRIEIKRIHHCFIPRTAFLDYPWERDEFQTPPKPFDAP